MVYVSIHAPAWGATGWRAALPVSAVCFNPRTRVGCDPRSIGWIPLPASFNPRTRVGCDSRHVRHGRCREVSIHAPAWGATARGRCAGWPRACFNPRTRVGCDCPREVRRLAKSLFQSTHPRGVRRDDGQNGSRASDVSIHAPAWGATAAAVCWCVSPSSFNPRTRVGCDRHWGQYHARGPPSFNPRTRVGCDSRRSAGPTAFVSFNPRTSVGCDIGGNRFFLSLFGFQSTHPRGVRR